jgi:hypothetical protein
MTPTIEAHGLDSTAHTKGSTMNQKDPQDERYAELSLQWYGWGSPIGLGIGLIAIGGFVTLLALAWQLVS